MEQVRNKLIQAGVPQPDIKRFLAYVDDTKRNGGTIPNMETLYSLFIKYWNVGLVIDGVNVALTGANRAMIQYHGYKNKVMQTYPELETDIQLYREGDTFNLKKDSGKIIYEHKIADPFGNAEIKGAYAIFKTKRGEVVETLNREDYEKMKKESRNPATWEKWESQFWLKSVIKRICKRYFYDIVADIDKVDNEDYGAVNLGSTTEKKDDIVNALKNDNNSQDGGPKDGTVVPSKAQPSDRIKRPRTPSKGKTTSAKRSTDK